MARQITWSVFLRCLAFTQRHKISNEWIQVSSFVTSKGQFDVTLACAFKASIQSTWDFNINQEFNIKQYYVLSA
jgi:hypothetical protein